MKHSYECKCFLYKKLFILITFLSLLYQSCFAVIVGSKTAASAPAFTTFPNVDTNNKILGFAFMESGFALESATTSCTHQCFVSVSGNIYLNGGRFTLRNDFVMTGTPTIVNGGLIEANKCSIILPRNVSNFDLPSVNTFPLRIKDGSIVCNSDISIKAPIQIIGSCRINGRGKRLSFFNSSSNFIIRSGASLLIEDAELLNIFDSSIRCLDDRGTVTIRNCLLSLANNFSFSRGSILFEEDVVFTGTNKFNYTTRLASTISSQSLIKFDFGTTFSYAPQRSRGDLLYMIDETSIMYLNGCSLFSTRTGLQLSQGTLIIENRVTMSSDAKFNAEGLRLGQTLTTLIRGGATLDLYGKIHCD